MRRGCVYSAALALASVAMPLQAEPTAFATVNQSPLVQIFGLPVAQPPLRFGEVEAELSADLSNNYLVLANARESLVLDGESYRTQVRFRRGHANGITFGIALAQVRHSGGVLDSTIAAFHDTFNLPQGGRDLTLNDTLTYRYSRDGVTRLQVRESGGGIGDTQLSAAVPISAATWAQASVKLPTGASAYLFGSGSTDVSVALNTRAPLTATLGGFGGAGVLLLTRGAVLPEQQRHAVVFGHIGGNWRVFRQVIAQIQVDGHSGFYRASELAPLRSGSLQLGLGMRLEFTRAAALEFALIEDVQVATAPDATFHLRLRLRY